MTRADLFRGRCDACAAGDPEAARARPAPHALTRIGHGAGVRDAADRRRRAGEAFLYAVLEIVGGSGDRRPTASATAGTRSAGG